MFDRERAEWRLAKAGRGALFVGLTVLAIHQFQQETAATPTQTPTGTALEGQFFTITQPNDPNSLNAEVTYSEYGLSPEPIGPSRQITDIMGARLADRGCEVTGDPDWRPVQKHTVDKPVLVWQAKIPVANCIINAKLVRGSGAKG